MNPISRIKSIAKRLTYLGFLVFCLSALDGCVSAPNQNEDRSQSDNNNQQQTNNLVSVLTQIAAKYSEQQTDPIKLHTDRNTELLSLANVQISEEDCISTNIIIKFIDSSITNEQNRAMANLFKVECELQKLGQSTTRLSEVKNKEILDLLETWSAQSNFTLLQGEFRSRYAVSNAKIAALSASFDKALVTLLEEPTSVPYLGDQQANDIIWQWFSLVPESQKLVLVSRFPILENFSSLFNMVEDASVNDSMRQATIKQWLQQNQTSTIARYLPEQLTTYLALESTKQHKIAVLLPLSGRLSSQGEAIKQGLLAAYLQQVSQSSSNNNQARAEIEFIDTGSITTLPSEIDSALLSEFEIVIGPLLKSHIEQIQALNIPNLRQVVLNQNETIEQLTASEPAITNQSITAFFALSPEQEAQQLVLLMRKQQINNPVLIKDNSNMANRMAIAFNRAWEQTSAQSSQLNNSTIINETARPINRSAQEITYTNNKSMRVGITSALDVLQSQRRIQQLSNLHKERIYSVTRNRRDIDAFVVLSQPDELELINPIIETSISLFTNEQLPVFATSYSYDHKQSKNSQRDLRNLIFIDMPWLIRDARNDDLSAQVDKLFNRPPSTFLRLFAFGFDALAIADNIVQLSTFDYMKIKGLTGTLSLTNSKLLNRELDWLAITEDSN